MVGAAWVKHISVCVVTYRRPLLLAKTLRSVIGQKTGGAFTFSVVVVDNDCALTAKPVVDKIKADTGVIVDYYSQPQKNISLARNMAVEKSRGDYIAFLDDDAYANCDWLENLYKTLLDNAASVVNGLVAPDFEGAVRPWVKRSGFFDPPDLFDRNVAKYYRSTNNCLIDRQVLREYPVVFDPQLGLCGGEDTDLFNRLMKRNIKFCWYKNISVYEYIPASRANIVWMARRAFRAGNVLSGIEEKSGSPLHAVGWRLRASLKVILRVGVLPVFLLFGLVNFKVLVYFIKGIILDLGRIAYFFWGITYYEYEV